MQRHKTASSWKLIPPLCILGAICVAGCGAEGEKITALAPSGSSAPQELAANKSDSGSGAAPGGVPQKAKTIQPKIVYIAEVELQSDNLSASQEKLLKTVKQHHGYVSEMEVGAATGHPRDGTWKVRVPVAEFDSFMAEVSKIAELRNVKQSSEDVTSRYYDAQAHLQNKRVEEARLLKLLGKSTHRLSEILEVEREISRVRGEIEVLQGQINLLENTSSMSTVTVSIHESKEFVPDQNPAFGKRVSLTFISSLTALRDVILNLLLIFIALLPWLVVAAIVLVPMWRILLWMRHRKPPPPN